MKVWGMVGSERKEHVRDEKERYTSLSARCLEL